MGYTTDFSGEFNLNKPLTPTLLTFLTNLASTRRMMRNLDEKKYGHQGEFYCEDLDFFGQNSKKGLVDNNKPPTSQPSLWLHWIPAKDGTVIKWDGGEKFYNFIDWIVYLIEKILKPNGYSLTGTVTWQGEGTGDVGKIIINDDVVMIQEAFRTELYIHKSKMDMRLEYLYIDITSQKRETKKVSNKEKVLQLKLEILITLLKKYLNPDLVDELLKEVENKKK